MKRLLDVGAALTGLLILLPVLAIVSLAIVWDSRGPVLYASPRVGRGGRLFSMWKFRSMRVGADRSGPLITAAGDPRITRVGRFLRSTKLDELPTLWNVLAGDMSLVGPRPENPKAAALYSEAQRSVLAVRPGVTSVATVMYRHEERLLAGAADLDSAYFEIMQHKLRLELDYLRTRSLWTDLIVIGQTVRAIFRA
jgi:lipopolysaccharide/colanic/teichoic acid biosynthesis glycosyltransferase